jgi:hypothetical protein
MSVPIGPPIPSPSGSPSSPLACALATTDACGWPGDQWRLLRVSVRRGRPGRLWPYAAAPERAGYTAAFEDLRLTDADRSLH